MSGFLLHVSPLLKRAALLALLGSVVTVPAAPFPEHKHLAEGPWRVQLLPGAREFVFTIYGAPSDVASLRNLVAAMREKKLGNGFDPGPSARALNRPAFDYLASVGWPVITYPGCADMQIKGGDCVLGPADQASLVPLDRAGVFNAVQLGEWGYYFHILSCAEPWWREIYGQQFEAHKHLMKPAGLAGYDRRPASRRECYEILKDYFQSRSRDLLDRTISVTGYSHYEPYAAEWGTRCVGLEVAENIAFTQSKLAFARGASRQWQRPWSVQVSPWFAGICTTARALDAGHSLSLYERLWLHGWFAGAAMVTPENSMAIFFPPGVSPLSLTSHGRKAAEVFAFMRAHDRGVPYTPVAIVLDHFAGYNAFMGKPWGILEPTAGDREVRDLFDHQLFPGSDFIHTPPDPANPEANYLRPTPYGESFDVLLTTVSPKVLCSYPVLLLAGDIEFDHAFLDGLAKALSHGTRVLMAARHQAALGTALERLKRRGTILVLEPWTNPTTGRPAAISDPMLRQLSQEFLPIQVTGDPIQYQINRTRAGWVIELVNNAGVIKQPAQAAVIDSKAVARVLLRPGIPCASAVEWRSGRTHHRPQELEIKVAPGSSEWVEFLSP